MGMTNTKGTGSKSTWERLRPLLGRAGAHVDLIEQQGGLVLGVGQVPQQTVVVLRADAATVRIEAQARGALSDDHGAGVRPLLEEHGSYGVGPRGGGGEQGSDVELEVDPERRAYRVGETLEGAVPAVGDALVRPRDLDIEQGRGREERGLVGASVRAGGRGELGQRQDQVVAEEVTHELVVPRGVLGGRLLEGEVLQVLGRHVLLLVGEDVGGVGRAGHGQPEADGRGGAVALARTLLETARGRRGCEYESQLE